MTIQLGSIKITLFKIERLERYNVQIDQAQAKADAEAIKNSASFQELKARAQAIKAGRNG